MAKEILPGQLRINDIIFDIPPQNIQIVKRDHNLVIPTLRSSSSTKLKSGNKEVLFIIDLVYATGYNFAKDEQQLAVDLINRQLAPLIIQIRKNPFCSIENEKIRKEMAGELGDTIPTFANGSFLSGTSKNMAGCIKSIRITTNGSAPELLRVQLIIKWFNYLPYTPTFSYLSDPSLRSAKNQNFTFDQLQQLTLPNRIDSADAVDSPEDSHYYQLFYKNGTLKTDSLGKPRFINEISNIDNSIEIIYKEYREATDAPSSSTGWNTIDTTAILGKNLEYQYRSFHLSDSNSLTNKSGALIPLNLEILLETKVPALSLLGHTIPTLQFLGVSDATINISLFANAELKNETPIESSRRLSILSNILEKVTHNSIKYRLISRRDPIFIRHPLLNLINYNLFTDTSSAISYLDENRNTKIVALGNLIPCIVDSVNTATIPEHPFCNTIDIGLLESYKKTSGDTRLKNQGMGRNIFDSLTEGLISAADFFEIGLTGPGGFFTSNKKQTQDWFNSRSEPLLNNLLRVLNRKREFSSDIREILQSLESDSEAVNDVEILTNLVANYALDLKPNFLSKLNDDLASTNTTSPETAYPDMKLPLDRSNVGREEVGLNPDFYWNNFSDITFPSTQEQGFRIAQETYQRVSVDKISKITDQAVVEELVGPKALAGKLPPPAVKNGCYEPAKTKVTAFKDAAHDFSQAGQSLTLAATVKSLTDNTYTMRRSMPTFKLYFLNDRSAIDRNETKNVWLNFEDFYNINSVKEVRLIRTKDLAADTLILQLTNLDDDLVNRDFPVVTKDGKTKVSYGVIDGEFQTKKSIIPRKFEKFDNLMLNEGTRIQLRLGYDSDPDKLSIEFNGRLTQISGSDMLELVCQGHSLELELEEKGTEVSGNKFSYNSETNDLLSSLISDSPEVESFGSRGVHTFFGENNFTSKFLGGVSLADNLFAPPMGYSVTTRVKDYFIRGAVLGGILGVPFGFTVPIGAVVGGLTLAAYEGAKGLLNLIFRTPFVVYHQTIWDVIKELELRHTDCIGSIVPYDTRMTLFFGYPEQLYFYRGYSPGEIASSKVLFGQKFSQRDDLNKLSGKLGIDPLTFSNRLASEFREIGPSGPTELDRILQYMKPFRNYHMVTSEHNIVYNNIRADATGTYNAVKVLYPKDGADINLDGSVGFEDYAEYKTIKADDDLHQSFIRTGTFVQHNAHKWGNVDLPKNYSLSLLKKSLAELYKGELGILGQADIKPYDIVFIFDSYTNIFGAVEVKQVIQTFSYETGWITEITPNMVIYTNNLTGRAMLEAISQIYGAQYFKNQALYYASKFDLDAIRPDESLISSSSTTEAFTDALGLAVTEQTTKLVGTIFKSKFSAGEFDILAKTATGAKFATSGLRSFGKFAIASGILSVAGLAIDNLIDEVISWAELREPLIFVPLKRNGIPWILGLYGLKPDSAINSLIEDASNIYNSTRLAFGRAVSRILGHDFGL